MKYEELKPYIEKKLISEQIHPEDSNVRIFNYTQECQFQKAWDDITMQCRGLIMNIETDEIIARPFRKFFNYAEHIANNWPIPMEQPIVTEKMDGSLGILYWLKEKPWIATRGSFTSDQAKWATNRIQSYTYYNHVVTLDKTQTHLFEIIYPENKIVINYDFSDLCYLGSLDTETGKQKFNTDWKLKSTILHETDNWKELEKLDTPNSEGFVLYFPLSDIRMKIKFPEYVRLHKIVTGLSEIGIWEMLRDGMSLDDIIKDVPDEFFKWVFKIKDKLKQDFAIIEYKANQTFLKAKELPTRKEQAELIREESYPGIVFAMLDGKDYKPAVWKLIRPHGQSAFKKEIDL